MTEKYATRWNLCDVLLRFEKRIKKKCVDIFNWPK